ncbi:hypothetical protein C3731_01640 [Brucella oryzae]|uniref:Uncharacterized protein n=1 Tax=Brucella oryzae TaxID=335286 RepID=A0A2S7J4Z1_9HYPH|nr:hypothetical protein C3731_01640 [Brucella oryzae]
MVTIVVFLFLSGRSIATSMGVVRPRTIGPHPLGVHVALARWGGLRAGTKWKAAGDGFFASRCKAEGGGKKLATDVAGDERGEAGPRSDPCQSRSRMERPFQEVGGIRQWRPSLRLDARERNRRGPCWALRRRLILAVMARTRPFRE